MQVPKNTGTYFPIPAGWLWGGFPCEPGLHMFLWQWGKDQACGFADIFLENRGPVFFEGSTWFVQGLERCFKCHRPDEFALGLV